MEEVVCRTEDLQPGEMMESRFGKHEIVVCRASDGHYYAFLNRCIHQGAPLSKGKLCGAPEPTDNLGEYKFERDGDILRCPWHGREFDIRNKGCMLANEKFKIKNFKVMEKNDEVIVYK
ncbi:Rieske (2Fe-2S) protein [Alkalicoccus daliensis]|uniref:Ferredoxin subunit of nitrite reductase or a ring-hydroxylating dioxygenase n=1 Tax=Alkalicoccus daliensis TaxID=745820 RepID=A0A1H0HHH4_9BACI|nr:Rieske (2Fe-2S) protein [Alkalicoccus daliensis]SDO18645.1 Ferredoxin subunit of nitrite reductase or a ring-hydroxylating dioxygenase [Alkalicoccus daliensis]